MDYSIIMKRNKQKVEGFRSMRRQALSLLVENNPGVTNRISGLFSRRGYNIDSFSSGVTADPRYTRITIVASGDELILEQIEKQLEKLEDVLFIKKLEPGNSVTRELILVKIRALDTQRQPIMNVTEIFRGNIVDVTQDSMVIELVGNQKKLDAFLNLLDGYEILELARTGITGLTRGSDDVKFLD
jgi:acetolactate synthase-1/3 small subunit